MKIRIIYDCEYDRVIPAVIKEARASIPQVKNQIGTVVKAYTDSQVALVTRNVIPYKIETLDGNLAGYVAIRVVSGVAEVYLKQLRPAFQQFDTEISQQINNFIINGSFVCDIL